VGAAIARALKARGDDVIVLDLAPECPVEGVDYRRVDITDKAAVTDACRGVDTVIHNASIVHTKGGAAQRRPAFRLHQLRQRRVRGEGHRERGREPAVFIGLPGAVRGQ
jgi:nucleoside-diphosphate-sugar epimerase